MRMKTTGFFLLVSSLLVVGVLAMATPAHAMPGFARKYNVACSTCHTIFPRLNKLGYEFKRLGYRMPPDVEDGSAAKPVTSLDEKIGFSTTNALAFYLRTSVSYDKATAPDGSTTSASSANLDQASILFGGAIPESGLSFFGEFVAYPDSAVERAKVDWTGGKVGNSYYVGIGKSKVQEGYSASDGMGLTDDDGPLAFGSPSPNGLAVDSTPGLVELGYSRMSPDYKYVLGVTAKVTNGVDANGEGIGSGATANHKDYWLGGDFLIGDHASVSAMYYSGRKDQPTTDESTYVPTTSRWGVFGHYYAVDHLDVLAGYIGGREDWKTFSTDPVSKFDTSSYFGELDYYIVQGLALFGRYDHVQYDAPTPDFFATKNKQWIAGVVKTIARRGFAKLYGQYIDAKLTDVNGVDTEDKLGKIGIDMSW